MARKIITFITLIDNKYYNIFTLKNVYLLRIFMILCQSLLEDFDYIQVRPTYFCCTNKFHIGTFPPSNLGVLSLFREMKPPKQELLISGQASLSSKKAIQAEVHTIVPISSPKLLAFEMYCCKYLQFSSGE